MTEVPPRVPTLLALQSIALHRLTYVSSRVRLRLHVKVKNDEERGGTGERKVDE